MDEIDLRFEALRRHLQARRSLVSVQAERLNAEGISLSKQADAVARMRTTICNEDSDTANAA